MLQDCQQLFETLSEAIIVLDNDGFIQDLNPAANQLTGYNSAELIGQPLHKIYTGDDEQVRAEYEITQARSKGRFLSEGWRQRKDGTKFWAEVMLTPIHNVSGNGFTGYSCIVRDVTDRMMREYEVRKSEERYRLMVENVKDYAIFQLDTTGHIMTWNEGARRIKGYSFDEIAGKHFSIFYTAIDLEDKKPERELKIAIATGKYEEEGWRVRKNGSVFWANVVITALYNDQNKHIGFSKVTRDLTERKENEEALRQSEERYRALVEQVTDYGIFMMDEKGRIVNWNEGAKNITGYTFNEIVGKYFSTFYPEEDIVNGKPAMELRVAKESGKYEEEGWRLRKDGTRFWASVVITAVYNAEGIHIGYSKVTRDLTERKEAERALRDSFERYRKLANELQLTNTELSYTNRELEQFTSIVSHDLQEPVRTIKSFLQLIDMKLDAGQSDDLKSYIGKSINAANRMRELILNLLHYSQVGKMEIVTERVKVSDIVNEALQNLKSSVDTSKATITVDNQAETVEGDRVQLVQLMQNLLSNALKFTDTNYPEVNIRAEKENGHVKFAVSDNGIGIAHNDMHKVFEIFRRLNTQKEYPGTGIGLAICKKIVDRHHGKIWPESNPGKGTTFYFTINDTPTAINGQ
ncbi:MAG: domain S-box protein [Flavipsychrobacter sp.]|nr:domain S-box protein [Flavipsychrobacter sp.]